MKKPQIKKLNNGLTVMTIRTDSPSVTVMSLIRTGSRFEKKDNNGISHFLEHMCFKGTTTQSGKDIMRYLDGLGAETNAFTSYELTGYFIKSITRHWKKTLKIVSDIYLNNIFPSEEIEKEKGVIIGEISMYEDMPMRNVHDIFSALVYGDQPAGWSILGPRENILNMQRDDVINYHKQHYVASNTFLIVSGRVNHVDVVREVDRCFNTISQDKKINKKKTISFQQKPQISIQYKETDQTHVLLGFLSEGFYHKDSAVISVIASILGGGMSSRLFEKLREDMGVGYYVHAYNNAQSDTGTLEISCGVDSKRVSEVLLAIQSELYQLSHELVPDIELKKTQQFIIGNKQMGLESTDDLAYHYGRRLLFGLPIETSTLFNAKIKSVSPRDIRRVAKKIITKQRLNLALIGPHRKKDKEKIMKLLK